MQRKKTVADSLSIRVARARQKFHASRFFRIVGGRGAAALLFGAMLSIGGMTEAMSGVHFLVEKDLDSVRIVKQDGEDSKVVANVADQFAGNSIFKLSRVMPDSLVTHRIALFDDEWLPQHAGASTKKRSVFHEEMARINDAIRREFFSNAIPYGDLIHEKAEKYDVDPALVAAVIEQESKFHQRARSNVGAKGLMQLMPRTGRWMGARDLYDPEQNVDAGVKYIKYLQEQFDGNVKKTIAAYNAGEGNVRRYGGIPPFRETQTYVKRVLNNYDKRHRELKQFSDDARSGGAVVEADGTLTLR